MDSNQQFRTALKVKPFQSKIDHNSQVITIGSCFSNSIGERLQKGRFSVLVNPFGTVFNPLSIFKLLSDEPINENGYIENDGVHFHHDFHSSFRSTTKNELQEDIKHQSALVSQSIGKADYIIITLGTAYVYEHLATGEVVNNCHKVPQREFKKRLLSMEELEAGFDELKEKIQSINPNIKFILTVSPVRHIKDGMAQNNLSKSILRVCCDRVSNNDDVHYFPSFEIMMDDLRDYRFYADDMLHPTSKAEDYIFGKFTEAFMSPSTQDLMLKWQTIRTALNHKAFNPSSTAHQKFLSKLKINLIDISNSLDVSKELVEVERQLVEV